MHDEPQLIGYFAKPRTPAPAGCAPEVVTEIASVSTCITGEPNGWIEHWLHNDLFVFDTPELARAVVPETERQVVTYAYRLLPIAFDPSGTETRLQLANVAPQPMPGTFRRIGYDVVSRSFSATFECSPLSCNGMAFGRPVNQFCLIDRLTEAVEFARLCALEQPEPGSYFVVEVWREE